MNTASSGPSWGRWLVCLLLVAACLVIAPAAGAASHDEPVVLAASSPSPLVADLFQEVVGNRTRLIQVSFLCILVGIFILWKK